MSKRVFTDNAGTTLAAGISAAATTCTVVTGGLASFPAYVAGNQFTATLIDTNTGTIVERVLVTAWNTATDTITTMVRGQQGTTAHTFLAGDQFLLLIVADTDNNSAYIDQTNTFTQPQIMSGAAFDTAQATNIASASTVNLETATGNYVHITGTTAITAITLNQGASRTVVFDGILTLTNGASLLLPSNSNITTAAGDSAVFVGEAAGVVRCISYQLKSSIGGSFTQTQADGRYPIYVGDAGGTADALTATVSTPITALYDGMMVSIDAASANTGAAMTFNLTLGTTPTGAISVVTGAGSTPAAGTIVGAGHRIILGYSSTTNTWRFITPAATSGVANYIPIQPISATVAANALTVTLSPTTLAFRSATLGSGAVSSVSNASSVSLTVPSGATLGTYNGVQGRLVIVALNNAGTIELGIVNIAGGVSLDETYLVNTTAITSGATSASVIYSASARTSLPFRVVGFVDITEATAGTWATAPSTIQGDGGKPLSSIGSIGIGQTYQDVTASRSFITVYYNTTGRPIVLQCAVLGSSGNLQLVVTINGVTLPTHYINVTYGNPWVETIIPIGASYALNLVSGGGTVGKWVELR